MQVELVQTTTRDGLRLDGALALAVAKGETSLPIDAACFVHGTGSNFYGSTLFDELGRNLLASGSTVLRVNTRGHDGISTAATAQGGRRLGAAYEIVGDCRHDLAAWIDWLRQRGMKRIGLIGHSLGAVKCLYALAHEPSLPVQCVVAISPPRLSYSWFCSNPEGKSFLEAYSRADQLVAAGEPSALIEVKLPLPMAITAAGYVEKYGPDERYDFFKFLPSIPCPALVTFGSIEVEKNTAFRGSPEGIANLPRRTERIAVETIAAADHFYSGVRADLIARIEGWLRKAG